MRIWGRMLEGITFLYFAWLWYSSAWQSDSMNFIYWPLAAMFVHLSYREQAAQKLAAFEQRSQTLRASPPAPTLQPHHG